MQEIPWAAVVSSAAALLGVLLGQALGIWQARGSRRQALDDELRHVLADYLPFMDRLMLHQRDLVQALAGQNQRKGSTSEELKRLAEQWDDVQRAQQQLKFLAPPGPLHDAVVSLIGAFGQVNLAREPFRTIITLSEAQQPLDPPVTAAALSVCLDVRLAIHAVETEAYLHVHRATRWYRRAARRDNQADYAALREELAERGAQSLRPADARSS